MIAEEPAEVLPVAGPRLGLRAVLLVVRRREALTLVGHDLVRARLRDPARGGVRGTVLPYLVRGHDRRPEGRQPSSGLPGDADDALAIGRGIARSEAEVVRPREAQAVDAVVERCHAVRRLVLEAHVVPPVRTADGAGDQRDVADVPGQRPVAGGEHHGRLLVVDVRDEATGRVQPDDPRVRGGQARRAAAIVADRDRQQPRGGGRRSPRARPSGNPAGVPRIPRLGVPVERPEDPRALRVGNPAAPGPHHGVGAHDDRAGRAQAFDDDVVEARGRLREAGQIAGPRGAGLRRACWPSPRPGCRAAAQPPHPRRAGDRRWWPAGVRRPRRRSPSRGPIC